MPVRWRWIHASGCLACAVVLAACAGSKSPPATDPGSDTGGPVTYTATMAAILDARCVPCHASTRHGDARHGAPEAIDYDTYALALAGAAEGNEVVQEDRMPLDLATFIPKALPGPEKTAWQEWATEEFPE